MSAPTLDRYELLDRIAAGGMAEVFRAKAYGAHGFEKKLAIKRILPDLTTDPEFEARFISEAKMAVGLAHANIVQVIDFGRFGGSLYIAMEYVDGIDLATFSRSCTKARVEPSIGAAMHIALGMLQGLDFAHRHGIIHRDISPSNILLSREGEVKVADFGIAEVGGAMAKTDRGLRVMGKWPYMSPEQLRGDVLDSRTDLFSAGIVLHELLSGRRLFVGEYPEQVARAVNELPIPLLTSLRSDIPPALSRIVLRLLERDRSKRYDKASEVSTELLELGSTFGIVAKQPDLADTIRTVFPLEPNPTLPEPQGSANILASIKTLAHTVTGTRATLSDTSVRPVGFVRGDVDADGLTRWELRQRRPTTPPLDLESSGPTSIGTAPIRIRRPTSRRALAFFGIASMGLAAVVAIALRHNDKPPPPSPAAAAAATSPEAPPPLRTELQLQSTPPGALVVINGAVWNERTPTSLAVAPSDAKRPHVVELRLPGYRTWKHSSVVVASSQRYRLAVTLEPTRMALDVRSTPAGAEIDLDGNSLGKTPLTIPNLPADGAQHTLRLHLAGHTDVTVPVLLEDGAHLTVDKKLEAELRYGRINVHVDPWADVYWNGSHVAEAPVSGLRLPVGRQRLKLVNPVQKRSTTITVDVPANGTASYRAQLPP